MALKFRRGNTAQQSGSLAFGEPYFNTDFNTLVVGSTAGDVVLASAGTSSAFVGAHVSASGYVSASSLEITGNANIGGDVTIGGKITIGDNTSDTVTVVASLSSSLIPSETNAFDLGDINHYWKDLYISTGSIKMVSNGVVVSTLSNTANGMIMDQGLTSNGNSSFGTSSAAVTAVTGSLGVSGSLKITGSINATSDISSSTLNGIGNVSAFSASISTSFSASNASVVALSQSVYDTLYWPTTGLSASVSSSIGTLSGSVSTSIAELSSSVSTSIYNNLYSNVSSLSQSFASASAAYSASVSESIYQNVWSNASSLSSSIAMAQSTYSSSVATSISSSIYDTIFFPFSGLSASVASTISNASSSAYSTFAKLSGDNIFTGTQTITGSLYVSSNLIVQGSSSLQNITASAVSIGTNTVVLNTANPSVRFGGISVIDDGASQTTGSLLWDSTNNYWIYSNPTTAPYASARLIAGPKNSGSLGNELGLTVGQVPVASGDDHISDSIISASATKVTIAGDLDTTGALSSSTITGFGNVTTYSSSVASRVNTLETAGYAVSSSVASATAASITTLSGSVKTITDSISGRVTTIEGKTLVSGSSQIAFSGVTGTVSNAQLANSTISGISLGGTLATLTIGTGLSGTSYNGSTAVTIANSGVTAITTNTGLSTNASAVGAVTITNTGVTSNVAGTGISVSGATGAVTITNSGVTSAVAGTGVSVSGATGAVTFSIGQAVATTSAVTFASVAATGDIVAYSTSDKRHKNNIQLIPNALEKVSKLNGVTWEWNDDVEDVTKLSPKTGLIAQEVQEVLPEVVTERENGFLGLDYSKMVGLLVEAIKEQQTQIAELKAEVEALKK